MQETPETWVWSLGLEEPLERNPISREMDTHSSILAWESLSTDEPGGLQPRGHKE